MKEKLGIDEKLNRLLKNVGADYFSKKEVEDEDYVSEDELEKSLARITKSINKASNLRKSVQNARTINKFEEERKTYKDLSKSERANILSNELIAGHRNVTALDVTKAEQGAPLNEACIAIIEKHIREERI